IPAMRGERLLKFRGRDILRDAAGPGAGRRGSGAPRGGERKIGGLESSVFRQNDGLLDSIPALAHVSRKVAPPQELERLGREHPLPSGATDRLGQEQTRERLDVFPALAQRRDEKVDDGQPV